MNIELETVEIASKPRTIKEDIKLVDNIHVNEIDDYFDDFTIYDLNTLYWDEITEEFVYQRFPYLCDGYKVRFLADSICIESETDYIIIKPNSVHVMPKEAEREIVSELVKNIKSITPEEYRARRRAEELEKNPTISWMVE